MNYEKRTILFKNVELREKEAVFVEWCCKDLPYAQIARKMGKSVRTIDGYRDEMFRKLKVRSRIGIVLWAFETGFVTIKKRKK